MEILIAETTRTNEGQAVQFRKLLRFCQLFKTPPESYLILMKVVCVIKYADV